jgi:hypothetical protein
MFVTDFLNSSKKLSKFNSAVNTPDLIGYLWISINKIVQLQKRELSLSLNSKIIGNLLKCLVLRHWLLRVKAIILKGLQKLFITPIPFDLFLVCTSSSSLTASFVSKYLSTRLLQKFPLRRLVSMLIRQLKLAQENALIYGFKIACNGRFARRGRATHIWKTHGKLPSSNTNIFVDYSIMLPVLLNSICAVKVWLTKPHDTIKLIII